MNIVKVWNSFDPEVPVFKACFIGGGICCPRGTIGHLSVVAAAKHGADVLTERAIAEWEAA